jgi:hypothetical protein
MRLATFVVVFASTARADTTVTLRDHASDKPLVNHVVTLIAPQSCTRGQPGGCTPAKPRRISQRTNKVGTARFTVDEGWQLVEVRVAGYLTRCPHKDIIETHTRHNLWVDSSSKSGRTIECRLVPKAALKVTKATDAIAHAAKVQEIADWLRTHAHLKPTAKLVGIQWDVGWADGDGSKRLVHIDALDGYAQVGGRWGD